MLSVCSLHLHIHILFCRLDYQSRASKHKNWRVRNRRVRTFKHLTKINFLSTKCHPSEDSARGTGTPLLRHWFPILLHPPTTEKWCSRTCCLL